MTFQIRDVWDLPHLYIGRRVQVFDRLGSTNTYALDQASRSDCEGLAVLAYEQLAGRGQHGRTWQAPPGSSVLLSVLVYPEERLNRPALLTAWAAVAVCEVVEALAGAKPRIKWPNDVLVEGRKVCGILIEQSRQGKRLATVVGIGLNLNQCEADFVAAGLPEATSLAQLSGVSREARDVVLLLLGILDECYSRLIDGDFARLEAAWGDYLAMVGREVSVECTDDTHDGRLVECALDGLVLSRADGELMRLVPEMVLHIRSR